ncbi:MAG: TIGR03905 family TSCPD domain-containing protein [Lachnospiraceae bacterium]
MKFEMTPKGVCPRKISFDLEGDVVTNVAFTGGCNGNLKAISKVVEGMTVQQIEGFFSGNTCGNNNTSCADQLAVAVRTAYEKSR